MYCQSNPPKIQNQNSIPIILEIGEFSTKVGFAGEDKPSLITQTVGLIRRRFSIETKKPKPFAFLNNQACFIHLGSIASNPLFITYLLNILVF